MATIKDISQKLGISHATVSYVLNDVPNQSISADTKKRILHVANMVGYVSSASARALATGKTNNFGVYVPHIGNSTHKQRLLHGDRAQQYHWFRNQFRYGNGICAANHRGNSSGRGSI